jgi:HEAT repeat protein
LEGAAVGALAMLEDGAGMNALMEMALRSSPSVRKAAVFWLGQSDHERARALVRTVVDDANETEAVRGAAIFALGQGDNATSADLAFLRSAFERLPSDRLKDRVLMAMSQNDSEDGVRWLLAQARDEKQPIEVRRKAAFWAGQGHARVADIVSLYKDTREPRVREHVIFVLSQRNEESATDALMSIARDDGDREMRKKALFWLAQKNDPRVTKLIADLVTR